ncbi:unnamed protein product, partial [Rotaria sordida]
MIRNYILKTIKIHYCVIIRFEIFKRGYYEAINKGLRPRGIIIVNPHNPTGDIYD